MPKNTQAGSVHIILLVILVSVVSTAAYLGYKTFFKAGINLQKNSDVLAVALKNEYDNPFDKDSQYVNPFSEYQNPFDSLK